MSLKRFLLPFQILVLAYALLVVSSNAYVASGSQWLDAKTVDLLARLVTPSGLAAWPQYSSDPATCNSNAVGAYYFNTTSSKFRTCDGSSWADREGAEQLNDLTDVFISSPSNNDHLVYDGVTDNRWENAAASASNIGDLGDVTISGVSNGEVLAYNNGTGDWENTAAGTSTLTGLTDTSISGPARGEILEYDGTDSWDNTIRHNDESFYLFPTIDPTAESNVSSAIIGVDNQVKVFCWNFPYPINIDYIIWATDTVTGTGCDYGAVGIYTLDGNTKLVDSGATAYSTNDVTLSVNISDVYLRAGTYYVAYTATETASCTVLADEPPGGTNDGYEALFEQMDTNGMCANAGTAANPSVSGALPSTLGTVTWNGNVYRPIILFQGTTQ